MKQVSTNEVSTRALKDALSVCGGLYSMNASYASLYVFNCDAVQVTSGMFAGAGEDISNYDYAIRKNVLRAGARPRRALCRVADMREGGRA